MEGLVGCVSFLVESLTGCLSFVVLIDDCKVDVWVCCLELRDFAVQSIFLKLCAHLTKDFLFLGEVLVLLDEIGGEAAELLKSLAAGKLVVHFALKLTQTLACFAHCFELIHSLGLVAESRHEILHVHVRVIKTRL